MTRFLSWKDIVMAEAEVSTIVGITFMVIGSLLVSLGLFLCYTTKVCKTFFLFLLASLWWTLLSIACNKSVQRPIASRNVAKKEKVRERTKEVNFIKAFSYFLTLHCKAKVNKWTGKKEGEQNSSAIYAYIYEYANCIYGIHLAL